MRIDKYLNSVNIVKRRALSQDMITHNVVLLNGEVAKASKGVKVGDIIEIKYLEGSKRYKVLKIPETKNIPKTQKDAYFSEL